MSTEVDALRARLQAYEHRETQWKQQLEKAQQEHIQLQSYQQKLTQAGTHLKALATDNARLQQELNQHTAVSGQAQEQLQKDRDDLAMQLEQQKKSNISAIEHLLQYLTLESDNEIDEHTSSASSSAEPPTSPNQQLPDMTDLEQVRHYIEATVSNMNLKLKGKDTTIASLETHIDQLQSKLHNIEQRAQNPQSPVHQPSSQAASPITNADAGLSAEFLEQNIKGIINDTDNFTMDGDSLPPQLMATLEHLRAHLQSLAESEKTTLHQNANEIKELKRQITQLQMSVNEWSEEKEQWLTEKEELETQLDNDHAIKDLEEKLNLQRTECQKYKDSWEQLQLDHQTLLSTTSNYENQLASSASVRNEHQEALAQIKMEQQSLLDKIADLESKLAQSESARQQSEDQVERLQQEHQALLDKIAHIKETLAPRLEADKQLRVKVTELTTELEQAHQSLDEMRSTMVARDDETGQQLENRDRHLHQLQNRLEKIQQEREDLEMATTQLDTRCSQLEETNTMLANDLEICKKQMAEEQQTSASERVNMENLQSVLEEFQTIKDAEIRAAVEHIERQLEVAKKSWTEYQERARLAESSLEQYQHDVAKTPQYEREIKEKNLLIGKLRHEAIILNEHLVEAMRRLKEESNESNVDRQLITNLVVGFLMAPRGDRKRFDILTIISNVLQMTEEQKEQVGLIRMKSNGNGQRSNTSSPSGTGWQSPRQQQELEPKESFTDAWISFLLKESSKRKPSTSSPASSPHSDQLDI